VAPDRACGSENFEPAGELEHLELAAGGRAVNGFKRRGRDGASAVSNAPAWNSELMGNACGAGPLQFYDVPPLAPGQTHTKSFGMCIPWNALKVTQYLKLSCDEASGSTDFCHAGANFHQRSIEIR
jgi:hypothetical protein